MVYEKALRLSTYATTGGKMTMGQITNHMSTDAMAVLYMFQTFYYLFSIPIQVGRPKYLPSVIISNIDKKKHVNR